MTNIEKQIYARSFKLKKYIEFKCYGQKELAEDLYGDTMLKILKEAKVEKLKDDSSLSGFMGFCAKSIISSYFEADKTHKRLIYDDYVYCIKTSERSTESEYEMREEIKEFVGKVEKKLGNTCRKIIMLLLFQNMDHFEIANTLGKDRSTISSHLIRIRKKLGNVHLDKYREYNVVTKEKRK